MPQQALLFLLFGVVCGYASAGAAGRHRFLGRVVDLILGIELFLRLATLWLLY